MADPVRSLALLWRSNDDPDGAALFATEDIADADLLQAMKLGTVEKRRPKPHQLSFFSNFPATPHDEMWVTYFVISPQGRWLWGYLVGVVDQVLKDGEDAIPGWRVPFI